jgi:hypothetical protein
VKTLAQKSTRHAMLQKQPAFASMASFDLSSLHIMLLICIDCSNIEI